MNPPSSAAAELPGNAPPSRMPWPTCRPFQHQGAVRLLLGIPRQSQEQRRYCLADSGIPVTAEQKVQASQPRPGRTGAPGDGAPWKPRQHWGGSACLPPPCETPGVCASVLRSTPVERLRTGCSVSKPGKCLACAQQGQWQSRRKERHRPPGEVGPGRVPCAQQHCGHQGPGPAGGSPARGSLSRGRTHGSPALPSHAPVGHVARSAHMQMEYWGTLILPCSVAQQSRSV